MMERLRAGVEPYIASSSALGGVHVLCLLSVSSPLFPFLSSTVHPSSHGTSGQLVFAFHENLP